MKTNKVNVLLLITTALSTLILLISATFSYFSTSNMSKVNALAVEAGKIRLGLGVSELYAGHLLIPLNDEDINKAYEKKCIDDYGWGACLAYTLEIFNYSDTQEMIGTIDFNITDIENLSYMVLDENNNKLLEPTRINSEASTGLTLGSPITIGKGSENLATSRKITLLIWLTNLEKDQSEEDAAGTFEASVTFNSTYGGRLTATVKGMESSSNEVSTIN